MSMQARFHLGGRLGAALLTIAMLVNGIALCGESFASNAESPNVVIIFADDQGYQDLGCFGSPHIRTPNIDRLAAEGMRFTSFYSAYCVCSASRASLMTGCYQPRLNMPGVLGPRSNVGLHPDEVTIADLLKTKGYATMCVGKWHLGDKPQTLPTAQGFDHYFGLPYSNDMARQKGWGNHPRDLDKIWRQKKWDIYQNEMYRDAKIVESPVNQVTLTDRYTEEAVKFIQRSQGKPFFLYFAHAMPHVPLFVPDERYDPDPKKAYRLAIEHIDGSVGKILEALEKSGVADRTLVVYTSDNGPWLSKQHHGGSALPLRAGKGTTHEGGMRVPGLMRWPARIPGGTVCHEVVGTIDLLPTIASIVGAKLPDHPIDGLDVSALLSDPQAESPHRKVGYFYYRNGRVEAVRQGKWKLRTAAGRRRQRQRQGQADRPTIELYDLEADIGETRNVAAENAEVVARLTSLVEEYDADLKKNSRPVWRGTPSPAAARARLRAALTFHASFDNGVDADFARGDGRLYTTQSGKPAEAREGLLRDDVTLEPDRGRHGGALRFGKKTQAAVLYRAAENVEYRRSRWSGTVSLWLRLDPARDLEPGYCDPIQITDKKWNDAAFFVDFTRDNPRDFRLGAFSDREMWNPGGRKWEDVPEAERPMVTVRRPPFSRDRWTHVVFTFESFNLPGIEGVAKLYIDGKLQGEIRRHQSFTWDPEKTSIFLGLSYIGLLDDLAVFRRALGPREVTALHGLPGGIASLRGNKAPKDDS